MDPQRNQTLCGQLASQSPANSKICPVCFVCARVAIHGVILGRGSLDALEERFCCFVPCDCHPAAHSVKEHEEILVA